MTTPTQTLPALPEPDFTLGDDHCYYAETVRALLAAQPAPAPDAVAEPLKGWKLNHARRAEEEGVAEIGFLDDEDDRFSPIVTVDTGLYYQPEQAMPLAVAILGMLQDAGAAPVAKVAEPLPRGRRTRAEFVKLARVIAGGCGKQHDAPSYLPRTPEAASAFEPHGWVVLALMQAHADGYDDGHSDGMAFVKAAHPQHPAPQPLTDASPSQADLIAALQFYADREHLIWSDEAAWDTVSGEPQNWWCDEAGTATVEDGTLAKMALAGRMTAQHFAALKEGKTLTTASAPLR